MVMVVEASSWTEFSDSTLVKDMGHVKNERYVSLDTDDHGV